MSAQISLFNYGDSYFYFCRVFYKMVRLLFPVGGFYFRNCGGTSVTLYL